MSRVFSAFLVLIALCTLSFGQTHFVLPPNGGNIKPLDIVSGQQSVPHLNIPFTFPAAPPGTTSVTIAYHRDPLVEWGIESLGSLPLPASHYEFGVLDNWVREPWDFECQGDWTQGHWNKRGRWVDHTDVPNGVAMKYIHGSGLSFWYGGGLDALSAYDGNTNFAGSSGAWGTQVGGQWTAFATDQVSDFQQPDQSGNVTIYFAPRGLHWFAPWDWPFHWYAALWAWLCRYNIRMSVVEILYQ